MYSAQLTNVSSLSRQRVVKETAASDMKRGDCQLGDTLFNIVTSGIKGEVSNRKYFNRVPLLGSIK
jgi:hypothetical protein